MKKSGIQSEFAETVCPTPDPKWSDLGKAGNQGFVPGAPAGVETRVGQPGGPILATLSSLGGPGRTPLTGPTGTSKSAKITTTGER